MRSICILLLTIMLLSLGACYPMTTAPAQMIPSTETALAAPHSPTAISVTNSADMEDAIIPTLTQSPIRATITSEEEHEFSMPVNQPLTITIVYDNNPYDQRLGSAWGFSALVEYHDHSLLFDTGGDGKLLLENMRILGIDPARIDSIVLSHAHEDHTSGLAALLDTGIQPVVYLFPSFPVSAKYQIEHSTQVSEVTPGQFLAEGLWSTGEMGGVIPEQALVVQTKQGLVVITGCAHPGIVAIIEQAQSVFAEPVRLVLGGFHLGSKSEAEIAAILEEFRRLKVEMVAPCHCTGESAIQMFAAEYGNNFMRVGVGSVIRLEE